LERLDIVLASLHERAGQTPDQLQRRYDAAMRHPLVNLITHPTNRLLPHREGYDLDYDRLFQTAVETGTILEIDGAPAHLDMDGELALTPRNGYPLYFAIGNLFLWTTRAEPAYALNLASAVEGAVACGLIVLVAAELSASVLAAIGAGLLFAVSYTFWSQSIIAEV